MSLKEDYKGKITKDLKKELGVKSDMAIPHIEKIIVNMGIGRNRDNKIFVKEALNDMQEITGQYPSKRKAKTSISNFKLREGQLVGVSVTLRGQRMWDFYEKFVSIVLPRVKDFRGVNEKSFDGAGNYNIGLEEHVVFPEIDSNKVMYNKPLQVTITTNAKDNSEGYALLSALGMPFRDKKKN